MSSKLRKRKCVPYIQIDVTRKQNSQTEVKRQQPIRISSHLENQQKVVTKNLEMTHSRRIDNKDCPKATLTQHDRTNRKVQPAIMK